MQLTSLIPHDFIAKKQAEYLAEQKQQLQQNEYIVICDFSENYSFVVQVCASKFQLTWSYASRLFTFFQDAVQGWHWANAQCTIHPFAIYYKDEKNILQHQSLVIIAESLKHNYEAVYQFQQQLFKFLKERFSAINKIIFFSDGAGGQYKNKKNFYQLCQYKTTHGFDSEWNFFATSHGKGPCDGIGGAFKRNATKASLQRPYTDQITTAKQLFDWAIKSESNIIFRFCTVQQYNRVARSLAKTFESVTAIEGTRKFHNFIPIDNNRIAARRFSYSANFEEFTLK